MVAVPVDPAQFVGVEVTVVVMAVGSVMVVSTITIHPLASVTVTR